MNLILPHPKNKKILWHSFQLELDHLYLRQLLLGYLLHSMLAQRERIHLIDYQSHKYNLDPLYMNGV